MFLQNYDWCFLQCFSIFYRKMVVIRLRVLATFLDERVYKPQVNYVPSLNGLISLLLVSVYIYM